MFRTPLKNSKSVNKPFKSPFDSPINNKEKDKINNKISKQNHEILVHSSLITRNLKKKRILDEDEKEKMELKITDDENEKAICQNLTKTDLLAIKRKIFEIRQALDRLKSKASCAKKHNPNDLKISINKWKIVCQNALQIIYSELKESGQNPKITDILNMLGISKIVVNYSIVDDTFI